MIPESLRFVNADVERGLPLAAVVWLVGVLLLVRWSRPFQGIVSRDRRNAVLGLRILGLTFAIVFLGLQPTIVVATREPVEGTVRVLVDASASMGIVEGSQTRSAKVDALLTDSKLVERLKRSHAVRIVRFGGDTTDLAVALQDAAAASEALAGIVVLSDGRQTAPGDPLRLADRLGGLGVPVLPIRLDPETRTPDASILSAEVNPPIVFRDAVASIELRVLLQDIPAGPITCTVTGNETPLVQTIEHDGTPTVERNVKIAYRAGKPGIDRLTVRLSREGRPLDTIPQNDQAVVVLRVDDEPIRVLVLDAEPRWEWHYLRALLPRDRSLAGRAMVLRSPDPTAIAAKPSRAEEWNQYDVIVLGDLAPQDISADDRTAIERFVSERGGTLILHAGKRFLPSSYTSDAWFQKLMPLESWSTVRPDKAIGLRPFPAAEGEAYLQLETDWTELPGQAFGIPGRLKEHAVGLLGRADMTDDFAWMARHNFGWGRVVYLGFEGTWRWRYRRGDTVHHRFWSQLFRWAAADRGVLVGDERIRFGPRQPFFRARETPTFIARLGADRIPDEPAACGLTIVRLEPNGDETVVRTIPFQAVERVAGEWRATSEPLPPGRYAGRVRLPDPLQPPIDGAGKPLQAEWEIAPEPSAEWQRTGHHPELLEEIARRSNGRTFRTNELDALVAQLAEVQTFRTVREEQPLVRSGAVLGLLLGLLVGVWLLHRVWELP